jgi:hypothetical protein
MDAENTAAPCAFPSTGSRMFVSMNCDIPVSQKPEIGTLSLYDVRTQLLTLTNTNRMSVTKKLPYFLAYKTHFFPRKM